MRKPRKASLDNSLKSSLDEYLDEAGIDIGSAAEWLPEYYGRPMELITEGLGAQTMEQGEEGEWDYTGRSLHHAASVYTIEAVWREHFVHERGPRKYSKTYKNADLSLAFFMEAPSIVLLIGPTFAQVIDQQMAGIKDRLRKANQYRKKKGMRVLRPHITERKISYSETHYIKAISADQPGAVQGYHAGVARVPTDPNRDWTQDELEAIKKDLAESKKQAAQSGHRILVLFDEGPHNERALFHALEGTLQGPNAYCLMTGNPDLAAESDHPYAVQGRPESKYHKVALSHLSQKLYPDPHPADKRFDSGYGLPDDPDVEPEREGEYGLPNWIQDRAWVHEKERLWGEGSGMEAIFKSHVLGQYAGMDDAARVIPMALLLATQSTTPEVHTGPSMGVDLAGAGGDRCVAILLVNGMPRAMDVWAFDPGDLDRTGRSGKRIMALQKKWGESLGAEDDWDNTSISPGRVHVDDTGGMVGVCDWLHAHGEGVDGVDFASKARQDWTEIIQESDMHFLNQRARMHQIVSALLRARMLSIPDEPWLAQLREEMTWPTWEWSETAGRTTLKVRAKPQIRKEHGRSPDIFDALMLACCQEQQNSLSFTTSFLR